MNTNITIDEYSIATIPLEMFFDATALGVGTAFIWKAETEFFLITNWHNVSGKDAFTKQHMSATLAEPNYIECWLNAKGGPLGNRVHCRINLLDSEGVPRWLVHPQHGSNVDIVALPISENPQFEMYPINTMSNRNLAATIGMDVFVLGYPYGTHFDMLPTWKRGSIASEPELVAPLHMLIDTASRPGMSGSPIIRRSWGSHIQEGGGIMVDGGSATRVVGVYSGRFSGTDPLDAQLGIGWSIRYVEEIIAGNVKDQ